MRITLVCTACERSQALLADFFLAELVPRGSVSGAVSLLLVNAEVNRVVGPALRLPPRLALSIAMALHELGTNAVKYGALSTEGGCVEISWTVRREAEAHLFLRWAESGGPLVKKPTRTGFGSRLIERSLARELAGEVTLTYEPSGVVCTINAPVPPPGLLERKSVAAPTRIAPLPLAG